jgi:hypothetical protein
MLIYERNNFNNNNGNTNKKSDSTTETWGYQILPTNYLYQKVGLFSLN